MSQLSREERLERFGELTKVPGIKLGRVYADELFDAAEILIPHPLQGRPWRIVGADAVPGFWHLETSFSLGINSEEARVDYTICSLVLPEEQFKRIQ